MKVRALIAAVGTILIIIVATQFSQRQMAREEAQQAPPAPAAVAPAGRSLPKVELYTTSWCPACREAVAFLQARNVPFTEYDVENDRAAAQRFVQMNPRGAVPLAVIGDEKILGFNPEAYARALGR